MFCDARAGTFYTTDNRPAGSPYVFTVPSPGELASIPLISISDCVLGFINVGYKTCATYDLSLVSVDASGVNN